MDTCPITARSLQRPYHIKGDEFERAYKDFLSGYRTWEELAHAEQWLVFPENVGPRVSIDETSLSRGEIYTIVANKDGHAGQGTLIAIVKGTRIEDVVAALKRIDLDRRRLVKEVTMDFSDSMRSIVEQCFPEAETVVDRFHAQKLAYGAMQAARMTEKRKAVKAENKARKAFKKRQQANRKRRKQGDKDPRGRKPARKNEAYKPERLSNGDTVVELLTRSRYLLMRPGNEWTESQKTRAALLFELFPDIKEAYSLAHSLRARYNNKTDDIIIAGESIREWCRMARESGIEDFDSVADTIEDRFSDVLHYFRNRATNAFAESLNAKIKNFRAQVRGVVDTKFFLYRVSLIFG